MGRRGEDDKEGVNMLSRWRERASEEGKSLLGADDDRYGRPRTHSAPEDGTKLDADDDLSRSHSLPHGWRQAKDTRGRPYYWHVPTRTCTYDDPSPLPPGWRLALDRNTGRLYFWHKATRETCWDMPAVDLADDEEGRGPCPTLPVALPTPFSAKRCSDIDSKLPAQAQVAC